MVKRSGKGGHEILKPKSKLNFKENGVILEKAHKKFSEQTNKCYATVECDRRKYRMRLQPSKFLFVTEGTKKIS